MSNADMSVNPLRMQFPEQSAFECLYQLGPLTILAASCGGGQDFPVFSTIEGVAVAVQWMMERGEVSKRKQTFFSS